MEESPHASCLAVTFKGQPIRIIGTLSSLWWVASDTCNALDLRNITQHHNLITEPTKFAKNLMEMGLLVNEIKHWSEVTWADRTTCNEIAVNLIGLNRLVSQSSPTVAKEFKAWMFADMFPSIWAWGESKISTRDIAVTPSSEHPLKTQISSVAA
jgi:prophage antirepressor-like protein